MSPQEFITDLCQRYGVSAAFGRRMQPLAERAERVRPEMRRRLHAFLERSFVAQATMEAKKDHVEPAWNPSPDEVRVLESVGGILHEWDPPGWLGRWAEQLDEQEPE